ncbi:HlyD family type I secretion periplasmic adaptor subunit [Candidatus Fokinia crypta]|uniref:Membrane fusion protein (MFP) family protein n=1 Tax=Candidatus Fokinia crypta TaxID=1920990 RepID=A0ABZ0UPQ8_9RICK|nr:HlyD family type I secretion periplasmic adaptor subunit [Candidatus Fokinia cryptica]WPX97657.1 Putative AprE family type I secretion periplasmic adaptor subunit [Candidatus Fokinia cryptica]
MKKILNTLINKLCGVVSFFGNKKCDKQRILDGMKNIASDKKSPIDADAVQDVQIQKILSQFGIGAPKNSHGYKKMLKDGWHSICFFISEIVAFLKGEGGAEPILQGKIDQSLKGAVKKPVKFVMLALATFFVIFVLWAGFAPIDSAVIARGVLVLENNRKSIQHPEGGVIKTIFVKDGDIVKKGDPIVQLEGASVVSDMQATLSTLRFHIAAEIRLLAELNKYKKPDFNNVELDIKDPEVKDIIATQTQVFNARKEDVQEKLALFASEKKRKLDELKEYEKQLEVSSKTLKIEEEKLSDVEKLSESKILSKFQLSDAQRVYNEYLNAVSKLRGAVAVTREEVKNSDVRVASYLKDIVSKISDEYKQNHLELLQLRSRYLQALDRFQRLTIRAPESGLVTGLRYHTEGGVISHNDNTIASIINPNDEIIVEAYVMPQDLIRVQEGMKAKVQLEAEKQRLVPKLPAEVFYVSADRQERPPTSQTLPPEFYLVKLRILGEKVEFLGSDVELRPGKPVSVYISKGATTMARYFLGAVLDSMNRAIVR